MGKKGRKFIDKNAAVTFKVVHRSQQDPLVADESAPQMVLVPVRGPRNEQNDQVIARVTGEGDSDSDLEEEEKEEEHTAEEKSAVPSRQEARTKRLDHQASQGIFYNDDYDYMQHLKPIGEDPAAVFVAAKPKKAPKVKFDLKELPAEVLPSAEVNPVGMLNLAAPRTGPQLDVDFEVMAALDDDAQFDEEFALDDDFMAQAEGEVSPEHAKKWAEKAQGKFELNSDDEQEGEDYGSDGQFSDLESNFSDEETRSRFTEYSMTSSIMSRTRIMQDLDDRFEKLYADYDADQVGELDPEEAEGGKDIAEFEAILDNYLDENKPLEAYVEKDPNMKNWRVIREAVDAAVEPEMDDEEKEQWRLRLEAKERWLRERRFDVDPDELQDQKWDAQTIVSTYSNIYNHPCLIKEERRKKEQPTAAKEAVAEDNESSEEEEDEDDLSAVDMQRKRGETKEERAARKNAVKAQRKARREAKKSTKKAFKAEELRQGRNPAPSASVRL